MRGKGRGGNEREGEGRRRQGRRGNERGGEERGGEGKGGGGLTPQPALAPCKVGTLCALAMVYAAATIVS